MLPTPRELDGDTLDVSSILIALHIHFNFSGNLYLVVVSANWKLTLK